METVQKKGLTIDNHHAGDYRTGPTSGDNAGGRRLRFEDRRNPASHSTRLVGFIADERRGPGWELTEYYFTRGLPVEVMEDLLERLSSDCYDAPTGYEASRRDRAI